MGPHGPIASGEGVTAPYRQSANAAGVAQRLRVPAQDHRQTMMCSLAPNAGVRQTNPNPFLSLMLLRVQHAVAVSIFGVWRRKILVPLSCALTFLK